MFISEMHQTKIKFCSTYCLTLRTERSDSHAVKLSCGLRCLENGLLNSPPAGGRFRHHFPNVLPTTKFLGELCRVDTHVDFLNSIQNFSLIAPGFIRNLMNILI